MMSFPEKWPVRKLASNHISSCWAGGGSEDEWKERQRELRIVKVTHTLIEYGSWGAVIRDVCKSISVWSRSSAVREGSGEQAFTMKLCKKKTEEEGAEGGNWGWIGFPSFLPRSHRLRRNKLSMILFNKMMIWIWCQSYHMHKLRLKARSRWMIGLERQSM